MLSINTHMALKIKINIDDYTTFKFPRGDIRTGDSITIDWGTGDPAETFTATADAAYQFHEKWYESGGGKTITVTGDLRHWGLPGNPEELESGSPIKMNMQNNVVEEVIEWTELPLLTSLARSCEDVFDWAYRGIPAALPSTVTDLSFMFYNASLNPNYQITDRVKGWDVSNITNMSGMFAVSSFRKPGSGYNPPEDNDRLISSTWDTSNVTDFSYMFQYRGFYFTDMAPFDDWDVSSGQNFKHMFYAFDVSPVFKGSNIDGTGRMVNSNAFGVNSWDMSSATNLNGMFSNIRYEENLFELTLDSWDVSNVTDMGRLFQSRILFVGDLSDWNTSNVTSMNQMFFDTWVTTTGAGSWDVSSVTDFTAMWSNSRNWNDDLSSWDVSAGENFTSMFSSSSSMNIDFSDWASTFGTVKNNINVKRMFASCEGWSLGGIANWDMSRVVDASYMLYYARFWSEDLSSWDVSNVTDMTAMLTNCYKFCVTTTNVNSVLSWNYASVTSMGNRFVSNETPGAWYDSLLKRLVATNSETGVGLDTASQNYTDLEGGDVPRATLVSRGWNITGDTEKLFNKDITIEGTASWDIGGSTLPNAPAGDWTYAGRVSSSESTYTLQDLNWFTDDQGTVTGPGTIAAAALVGWRPVNNSPYWTKSTSADGLVRIFLASPTGGLANSRWVICHGGKPMKMKCYVSTDDATTHVCLPYNSQDNTWTGYMTDCMLGATELWDSEPSDSGAAPRVVRPAN